MNWGAWLYGLLTGTISAFSTAVTGVLALPTVFTFDHNGFINMAKMAVLPAAISFFGYLKTHPLPDKKTTVSVTVTEPAPEQK